MSRTCSQCGNNGHNSRTCTEVCGGEGGSTSPAPGENAIMLFGVRVTEAGSSFRKSASMTNLSQYDQPPLHHDSNAEAGYASDDVVHASGRSRERKRGTPWTEEEHKLFLLGLQKVGKGDWRGISRNFVKTRTPTQVASHAQKYFLRRNNHNRRRRRSSLFDITTDTFMNPSTSMEDLTILQEAPSSLPVLPHPQQPCNIGLFPVSSFPMTMARPLVLPITVENSAESSLAFESSNQGNKTPISKPIRPIPLHPPVHPPPSAKMADLNLNKSLEPSHLSLKLSGPSSSSTGEPSQSPPPQRPPQHPPTNFQAMPKGDSIISVA
ncbi:transcription factor MYB1R1 [Humulus lupulus]|uniref:transcription factor MYB1R1 n=1 Tax=Humulus lupulus TaxID=3486 RepID=UPI002B40F2FF|nr:transcription factor MYB1R1 [Humulus lupulus]